MSENALAEFSGGGVDLALVEETARRFVVAEQISSAMCKASLLPEHLRTRKIGGKITELEPEEIKANCILIVNQALRWGVDPFAILPSTFVIGGKLGFDGKLIAAIVNKLGGLSEKLSYAFSGEGPGRTVTVSGRLRGESEVRTVSVTVKDAATDNEIWKKDPDQKLVYTGATRWARRHCPHVILGIISDDEPEMIMDAQAWSAARPQERAAVEFTTDRNAAEYKVDKPAEKQEEVIESRKLTIGERVAAWREAIAEAKTAEEVRLIGEQIVADTDLPEPARLDLREIALRLFRDLS